MTIRTETQKLIDKREKAENRKPTRYMKEKIRNLDTEIELNDMKTIFKIQELMKAQRA